LDAAHELPPCVFPDPSIVIDQDGKHYIMPNREISLLVEVLSHPVMAGLAPGMTREIWHGYTEPTSNTSPS
jgi:hypothetical protein